ncbi:MAG: RNA 3'-terminal phosphate cyclase [Pseudomonadota bacterium]
MIEIDGSVGEGGGQILRTALALSMCTAQPFTLRHIRAKRPKPGLMRQHLACVRAAQAVSGATVQGAELDSMTLVFEPGAVRPGEYAFDVGSAGSSTLVLQTVWPALLQGDRPTSLQLTGGTHNPLAPPFPFIDRCFAPLVRRLGAGANLTLKRHGFAPQGGGVIEAVLTPAETLVPFDLLQRGVLRQVQAQCVAPGLGQEAALQALVPLQAMLSDVLGPEGAALLSLETPCVPADEGPGRALMVTLTHAEVSELATLLVGRQRRGERAPTLTSLRREIQAYQVSDGALGEYLTDQWALPLALAVHQAGRSVAYSATVLSLHSQTNFEVISRFLPVRFETAPVGRGWRVAVAPGRDAP